MLTNVRLWHETEMARKAARFDGSLGGLLRAGAAGEGHPHAPKIIAEDDDHAWELAYRVFIDPAAAFGGDQDEAEELAYSRIEVRS
jgi:hypothetical protein